MGTHQQKQQETIENLEAQIAVAKEALHDFVDTTNTCGSRGADAAVSFIHDEALSALDKINKLETNT